MTLILLINSDNQKLLCCDDLTFINTNGGLTAPAKRDSKITEFTPNLILGISGSGTLKTLLARYIRKIHPVNKQELADMWERLVKENNNIGSALGFFKGDPVLLDDDGDCVWLEEDYYAIGCGAHYALGALDFMRDIFPRYNIDTKFCTELFDSISKRTSVGKLYEILTIS